MATSLKAERMPRRPAPGHLPDVGEVLGHRLEGLNVTIHAHDSASKVQAVRRLIEATTR